MSDIEKNDDVVAEPHNTKKEQSKKNLNMLYLLLLCGVVGGGGAIYLTKPKAQTNTATVSEVDKRLERAANQNVHPSLAGRRNYGKDFADKIEGEVGGINQDVSNVKQLVEKFEKENEQLKHMIAQIAEAQQQDRELRNERDEDLKVTLAAQAEAINEAKNSSQVNSGFPQNETPGMNNQRQVRPTTTPTVSPVKQPRVKDIERSVFKLNPPKTSNVRQSKNTNSYIPAGAYAPGRIIMGAKTSAAVDAQSDPRPILIRVRGKALGPMVNGKHTETDIDGCTITASAYGDISSEQGHAKLQEMSCATSPTEVKTVRVYGYIGHRGSYGVHADVVMREGDLAQRAFWAGMISNVGDAADLLIGSSSSSALGNVKTASGGRDAAMSLLSGGANEAGSQLSSYYIKRLEQIQPVIPLKAGTPIDIVFMKEVSLDESEGNVVASTEMERIPLDAPNSDVAPKTINKQVLDILQKTQPQAPNITNWNNEFYGD